MCKVVQAALPAGDAILHLLVPEASGEVDAGYPIVLRPGIPKPTDLLGRFRPPREENGRDSCVFKVEPWSDLTMIIKVKP